MKGTKPNLPITMLAAEATIYADDYLARMKRPPFYLGDGRQIDKAPLDSDVGYEMAKAWFRATGPAHVLNLSQLVELATVHGELAAHEVLIELMSERQDRGEPLGPVLTAYDIRLKHTPFHPHRGWSRTNFVADLILFNLILELHERFGLPPTRHQATQARQQAERVQHRGCGCPKGGARARRGTGVSTVVAKIQARGSTGIPMAGLGTPPRLKNLRVVFKIRTPALGYVPNEGPVLTNWEFLRIMADKSQSPAANGARQGISADLNAETSTENPATTQAQTRRRRRATPAERLQARQVARFVHASNLAGQPLLIVLPLVSRQFPDISLDTALVGYVFRKLLAPELEQCGGHA